jgi:hypothetical protein
MVLTQKTNMGIQASILGSNLQVRMPSIPGQPLILPILQNWQ